MQVHLIDRLPFPITVCAKDGIITYMNSRSIEMFKDDGGDGLIGSNVLDCHPEPSRTQLESMLKEQTTNCYTIEKKGKKKIIYHAPMYKEGIYDGFVEISFEIPEQMQHFIRK
ncbi:MAG: fold domain protein [Ignavibacteria bacterium]|nr:fold domain protein [Ignavibacteria bacterium]